MTETGHALKEWHERSTVKVGFLWLGNNKNNVNPDKVLSYL